MEPASESGSEPAFAPGSASPAGPAAAVFRIERPEAALFTSDMHLDDALPALAERFFSLLDASLAAAWQGPGAAGRDAPALFLLGDIFEYWVGDDHLPAVAHSLAGRLAAFSGAGGRVFLMHGNRDFLLDVSLPSQSAASSFSRRCGATLLPDPAVIEVAGRRIALSHGDALCTDDVHYQQWRRLCRSPEWQQQFLGCPVAQRLAMAQSLRKQSMQAQTVTETISDVNQSAVDALMTALDTRLLIHGHTHQPMLHRWRANAGIGAHEGAHQGPSENCRMRWVLSDWAVAPPRGGVLPITVATAGVRSSD